MGSPDMVGITEESFRLNALLSDYLDSFLYERGYCNRRYLMYARTAKLAEEVGEVMQAVIGWTGDNPRKGISHTDADIVNELCDVILTAMCALHSAVGDERAEAELINTHIAIVYGRLLGKEQRNGSQG